MTIGISFLVIVLTTWGCQTETPQRPISKPPSGKIETNVVMQEVVANWRTRWTNSTAGTTTLIDEKFTRLIGSTNFDATRIRSAEAGFLRAYILRDFRDLRLTNDVVTVKIHTETANPPHGLTSSRIEEIFLQIRTNNLWKVEKVKTLLDSDYAVRER